MDRRVRRLEVPMRVILWSMVAITLTSLGAANAQQPSPQTIERGTVPLRRAAPFDSTELYLRLKSQDPVLAAKVNRVLESIRGGDLKSADLASELSRLEASIRNSEFHLQSNTPNL